MKYLPTCFCILLICITSSSQQSGNEPATRDAAVTYMYTMAGIPFLESKFSKVVQGSAFFNEEVMPGTIILSQGREYKNLKVRVNLLDMQVNYLNEKKVELIANTPIREVILRDTIHGRNHRFVFSEYIDAASKPENGFYELLQTGKAELYKQHKKRIFESKPYNSSSIEQRIQTDNYYFVLLNGQWIKIKKIKDFTTFFTDRKEEVLKFINEHKLSDNEDGFKSITDYYNTLIQK